VLASGLLLRDAQVQSVERSVIDTAPDERTSFRRALACGMRNLIEGICLFKASERFHVWSLDTLYLNPRHREQLG
jgi:hypothetical protein